MPIGILVNSCAIFAGGILGNFFRERITDEFKDKLNLIFGICAMSMGVSSVVLMEYMPAVVFAVILGTMTRMFLHLGERIQKAAGGLEKLAGRFQKSERKMPGEEFTSTLITVIVLFCASGTGIYGSLISGMSGDHSILIAKAILDLFTAMIFACSLGNVVALVSIPQFLIFFVLFLAAQVIFPLTTPSMLQDFKACGGILMLATGFRMIKVKMFPTADMIPAMILVMPCSWLWSFISNLWL